MLTDEQISEFQMLYKNRFGLSISREEAYEQGIKLIRIIELIYKPMTKKEYRIIFELKNKLNKHEITRKKI